jgi:hypothetical protein
VFGRLTVSFSFSCLCFPSTFSSPHCANHASFLAGVLTALEKLGNACILKLSPARCELLMSKEFTKGEQAFVDMTMSSLFEKYCPFLFFVGLCFLSPPLFLYASLVDLSTLPSAVSLYRRLTTT